MIADGYEFVESQAPEYDKTAGLAIYWRDLVDFVNNHLIILYYNITDSQRKCWQIWCPYSRKSYENTPNLEVKLTLLLEYLLTV